MTDTSEFIINSRKSLINGLTLPLRKLEAEGGCGVLGVACSVPIKGKNLLQSLYQMKNRGNGKGGGIAAVGLSPEQFGVSRKILDEDYIIQIAYLDESLREEIEEEFLTPFMEIHMKGKNPSLEDYRQIGLEIEPPQVWRYFCRVKSDVLSNFRKRNKMEELTIRKVEDEFVYQNSFSLNKRLYSSLGEKKAFVMSHGRNMIVLKIVGYAEQVIKYYKLDEIEAYVWIGHHRYPTKGKVWHPGGAHPFIGLDEALVHNGDFANYFSICEYLKQRNIYPLFLTDTEVAVLLFDLLNRVYEYPLEYLIEALAPTTERDFEMLPEGKKKIYEMIQACHIHGSPDGPWFFIIARNEPYKEQFQLLGITDTSMLRPQVFALQEGEVKIGLIASERQAIDATLKSLEKEDNRFWSFADMYWNARGGSYTDGGAFIFTVQNNGKGGFNLICTDKFGRIIETPKNKIHFRLHNPLVSQESCDLDILTSSQLQSLSPIQIFNDIKNRVANMSYEEFWSFCQSLIGLAELQDELKGNVIELFTLLMDRVYDVGHKKRSCILGVLEYSLEKVFESMSFFGYSYEKYVRIDWNKRRHLSEPLKENATIVINAERFDSEGEDSIANFIVQVYKKGWKKIIVYNMRGQRFCGCGFGAKSSSQIIIHIYGNSGDYLASGLDGAEIYVHGSAQDQVANIMRSGKLVIYGDVGQTFMYGAKGGEVYVFGNAAGRPLINAVGKPKVVINGTCLDYLAESFMAGDPLNGGGFVLLNGIKIGERGEIIELDTPYPGGNLFSLASGGAIYIRDPYLKLGEDQLNGGKFSQMTQKDMDLIMPFLDENEKLFDIPVEELLRVDGKVQNAIKIYRKIEPVGMAVLTKYGQDVG